MLKTTPLHPLIWPITDLLKRTKNSIYDFDINVESVSFNAYFECMGLLHHKRFFFTEITTAKERNGQTHGQCKHTSLSNR
jgi:hypothetical protein